MVLASQVLESLENFVNQEVRNSLERNFTAFSKKPSLPQINGNFNFRETNLINELQSSVESRLKNIFGSQFSSNGAVSLNVIEEFSRDCKCIADACLQTGFECINKHPTLSDQSDYRGCENLEWFVELLNRLTSQLDYVLNSAGIRTVNKIENRDLWMSFVVEDLKRCIHCVNSYCWKTISDQMKTSIYSSVQLGRMYAWARETSGVNSAPSENAKSSTRLRNRICRKLSHLVGLSKAGKLRTRTHPLLASLKHDLLRIRTRATGKLSQEKHSPSHFTGNLHPMRFEDNTSSCIKQFLLPSLVSAFEKLSDDITESLLGLDGDVPGISFIKEIEDPETRHKSLHDQVSLAIFSFYTQLNESEDSEMGDAVIKQLLDKPLILPSSPSSTNIQENSEDLQDSEDIYLQMGSALVQTALDRFDHLNRTNYKRSTTNRTTKEPVEDQLRNHPSTQNSATRTSEIGVEGNSLVATQVDIGSGIMPAISDVTNEDQKRKNRSERINSRSRTRTTSTEEDDHTENSEDENESGLHNSANKKLTTRSLRTRRSRTPSENSYSEGEVLSDSEEDQETTDDDLGHKQLHNLGTLEKTKPSEREIQKEEMMLIVNKQLEDTTPVSDIDLTELEIMDEWAPPTVAVPFENPTTDAVNLNEITLPKDQLVEPSTTEQEVGVTGLSKAVEEQLQQTLSDALHYCQDGMQSLILHTETSTDVELPDTMNSFPCDQIKLPSELEASIERTASVFKEHVTSVLANLLHAAPSMLKSASLDETTKRKGHVALRRPLVNPKKSRLRGMLRAYQQDAKKRLNSNATE